MYMVSLCSVGPKVPTKAPTEDKATRRSPRIANKK